MTMSPEEFADYIEKLEHTTLDATNGFNMAGYFHPCLSPCCMAGYAHDVLGRDWKQGTPRASLEEILNVSDLCVHRLANPNCDSDAYASITPSQAATAIRKAIAGAPVDELWSHLS